MDFRRMEPNTVEYFEEEDVISCYDKGLSVIWEAENESCTSSAAPARRQEQQRRRRRRQEQQQQQRQEGEEEQQQQQRDQESVPGSEQQQQVIPENISFISSSMDKNRKWKVASLPSSSSSSPGSSPANRCDLLLGSRQCLTSPLVALPPPLTMTSYATGQEVIFDGDDDEFTFVSFSDNESLSLYEEEVLDSCDCSFASRSSRSSWGASSRRSAASGRSSSKPGFLEWIRNRPKMVIKEQPEE